MSSYDYKKSRKEPLLTPSTGHAVNIADLQAPGLLVVDARNQSPSVARVRESQKFQRIAHRIESDARNDGDGTINYDRLAMIVHDEFTDEFQFKIVKRYLYAMMAMLVIFGLIGLYGVFVINEYGKDVTTNPSNHLINKRSGGLVEVDVADIQVGSEHALVGRHDGLPITVGGATQHAPLSSTLPDAVFEELRMLSLTSPKGATLQLVVLGVMRVPDVGCYGSVVRIITHPGVVTLSGSELTVSVAMADMFRELGFDLTADMGTASGSSGSVSGGSGGVPGTRRLLMRAQDLVGIFNLVDRLKRELDQRNGSGSSGSGSSGSGSSAGSGLDGGLQNKCGGGGGVGGGEGGHKAFLALAARFRMLIKKWIPCKLPVLGEAVPEEVRARADQWCASRGAVRYTPPAGHTRDRVDGWFFTKTIEVWQDDAAHRSRTRMTASWDTTHARTQHFVQDDEVGVHKEAEQAADGRFYRCSVVDPDLSTTSGFDRATAESARLTDIDGHDVFIVDLNTASGSSGGSSSSSSGGGGGGGGGGISLRVWEDDTDKKWSRFQIWRNGVKGALHWSDQPFADVLELEEVGAWPQGTFHLDLPARCADADWPSEDGVAARRALPDLDDYPSHPHSEAFVDFVEEFVEPWCADVLIASQQTGFERWGGALCDAEDADMPHNGALTDNDDDGGDDGVPGLGPPPAPDGWHPDDVDTTNNNNSNNNNNNSKDSGRGRRLLGKMTCPIDIKLPPKPISSSPWVTWKTCYEREGLAVTRATMSLTGDKIQLLNTPLWGFTTLCSLGAHATWLQSSGWQAEAKGGVHVSFGWEAIPRLVRDKVPGWCDTLAKKHLNLSVFDLQVSADLHNFKSHAQFGPSFAYVKARLVLPYDRTKSKTKLHVWVHAWNPQKAGNFLGLWEGAEDVDEFILKQEFY